MGYPAERYMSGVQSLTSTLIAGRDISEVMRITPSCCLQKVRAKTAIATERAPKRPSSGTFAEEGEILASGLASATYVIQDLVKAIVSC